MSGYAILAPNDSFILGSSGDNGKLGRGMTVDDFEGSVLARWYGIYCTLSAQAP